MANILDPTWDGDTLEWRRARLGDQASCDHLGVSVYELAPGQGMVFHYHLQNEELLIVLRGHPTLRAHQAERELQEGDVVAFPRGEGGVHGYENRTDEPVRVLLVSEMNAPNVSVYPDTGQVGIFDRARRRDRRFGALFNLGDAVSGYGGGEPEIPPASGP